MYKERTISPPPLRKAGTKGAVTVQWKILGCWVPVPGYLQLKLIVTLRSFLSASFGFPLSKTNTPEFDTRLGFICWLEVIMKTSPAKNPLISLSYRPRTDFLRGGLGFAGQTVAVSDDEMCFELKPLTNLFRLLSFSLLRKNKTNVILEHGKVSDNLGKNFRWKRFLSHPL